MKLPGIGSMKWRNMSLVAMQWDRNFLDWIAVRPNGGKLLLLAAESIAIPDDEREPGRLLAPRIKELGLQGATAIVAAARGDVEVSELTLPPCSESELPLLVRGEMIRRMPDADENAAIDYVLLNGGDQNPVEVFAVLADSQIIQDYRKQAGLAGLNLRHMVYRPLALVSLLRQLATDIPHCAAHVSVRHDEVDVILTRDRQFSFGRSFRLSGAVDTPDGAAEAAQEIGRTLAVADASEEATEVFLFGSPDALSLLRDAVILELETPCEVLDPFAAVSTRQPCDQISRSFAPLIGAALEHVGQGHPIDLLQTKKAPVARHPALKWAAAGVGAVALMAVLGAWSWSANQRQEAELQELEASVANVQARLAKTQNKAASIAFVENWRSDDVTWIDELRDVSRRLPNGAQAMVKRLTMSGRREGGGVIEMQLQVSDPEVITQLETALRDPQHRVRSKRIADLGTALPYAWEFETQIVLDRRLPQDYATGGGIGDLAEGQTIDDAELSPLAQSPLAPTASPSAPPSASPPPPDLDEPSDSEGSP